MTEPRPSNRRLSRAAITIVVLVIVAVAAIFVGYNIFYATTGN